MANKTTTRRRHEQAERLATARAFAEALEPALDVRAVVVFGSVARGDFNLWSDIDVVVVADRLPPRLLDRLTVVGSRPRVQPVPWTPAEWAKQRDRGNPIVVEALDVASGSSAVRVTSRRRCTEATRGQRCSGFG